MLIVNDEQRLQAGIRSMNDRCQYCSKALAAYPLIMSDDPEQTVYHAACAVQLASEIMVDLYSFFSPPAPYDRLFVLCASVDRRDVAASLTTVYHGHAEWCACKRQEESGSSSHLILVAKSKTPSQAACSMTRLK